MKVAASQAEVLARFGHALSDPTRARLLLVLRRGPAYPSDLAESLGVGRTNLSNHLTCLRGCGLVVATPEGRRQRYELADDKLRHALGDLLTVVLAVDPEHVHSEFEHAEFAGADAAAEPPPSTASTGTGVNEAGSGLLPAIDADADAGMGTYAGMVDEEFDEPLEERGPGVGQPKVVIGVRIGLDDDDVDSGTAPGEPDVAAVPGDVGVPGAVGVGTGGGPVRSGGPTPRPS